MATQVLHLRLLPTSSSLTTVSSSSLSVRRRRSYQASITGTAIEEDDVQRQTSTERSSGLGSDGLWSSLSSYMNDDGREPLDASNTSQSLLGLSTTLFNDVNSFVMDKEDPGEYIPAPAISAAEMESNSQLEDVLYTLREVLPGPMVKIGMENKLSKAWSLVNDDIKVQDPLVCLNGKHRLGAWLHTLAATNVQVNLVEIYAERNRAQSCKGYIYAVWTLLFPEDLLSALKHPTSSLFESVQRSPLPLNLSGESKFEVDRTGQVISIESNWYATKEEEELLDSVKLFLASLLHREAHS
eukprot:c9675_g1_i1 orf=51-944(+)